MRRGRFSKRGALAIRPEAFNVEIDVVEVTGELPYREENNVAIVDICGPLTQHAEWFWDNYDSIKARAKAAIESSCTAVVLNINSPGGDVQGCFETAREIKALAATAKKPLYAFVDGMAASAAYALACSASTIVVPVSGVCGSVGVISTLFDTTALDRAQGLAFRIITSGARKADGHPHVAISDGAEAETQRHTDELAELFFTWVAEQRAGLTVESVRGLEARVFYGESAKSAGLADAVMTKTDLLAMVASGKAVAASAPAKGRKMGADYDQMRADLESDAEGDDAAKAKKAKRMLKALDDADSDGGDDDKKKDDDKGADADDAKKADADDAGADADDAKKGKADADDAKKADADDAKKAEDADAKAQAVVLDRLGKVERELAAEKKKNEDAERSKLLASRADLTKGQREHLSAMPLAQMKKTLAAFPPPPVDPAAAAKITPTMGEGSNGDRSPKLPPAESQEMRERMGLAKPKITVRRDAGKMVFPAMTPDEALSAQKGGAR